MSLSNQSAKVYYYFTVRQFIYMCKLQQVCEYETKMEVLVYPVHKSYFSTKKMSQGLHVLITELCTYMF